MGNPSLQICGYSFQGLVEDRNHLDTLEAEEDSVAVEAEAKKLHDKYRRLFDGPFKEKAPALVYYFKMRLLELLGLDVLDDAMEYDMEDATGLQDEEELDSEENWKDRRGDFQFLDPNELKDWRSSL